MGPKKANADGVYDDEYDKLELREQIMLRPDTYVGSLEKTTERLWVYNEDAGEMEQRNIEFAPGLFKIFDEILVNAADNRQRDAAMSQIKVVINKEKGFIQVCNLVNMTSCKSMMS